MSAPPFASLRAPLFIKEGIVLLFSLVLVSPALYSQVPQKRLSDWLLEQPYSADAYPLGLSWRVPEEVPPQHAMLLDLLRYLSGAKVDVKVPPEAIGRLRDWLQSLPVTGRVPVAVADARWLQGNPSRDPILLPGQSVVLPKRPRTVTVIADNGDLCSVPHIAGREAIEYFISCDRDNSSRADWVWLVQPDGRIQRFGVAPWNREVQDEPAPGAWIWGPARGSGWPQRFSEQLVAFLATQGPAPDSEAIVGPGPSALEPTYALPARSRGLDVTASDWGSVGLLQTPTARMPNAGHFTFKLTRTYPYTYGNIFFQPFDWLEAGFRYTNISNRPYGFAELSGTQALKDKSVDAKFRLLPESAYIPQVAAGLRDITGTGLFAGEYIVASKRSGALDWSLGLGWGYVGARGNLRNPLRFISRGFDTRTLNPGQGGNFSFGSYFHGLTALFGGLQYQSPWEPLILKLEYGGNDYQHEPLSNNQKQSSPWNFGFVYKLGRSMDLSLGVERGNTVMLGVSVQTQLDQLSMPKFNDPPRVPIAAARPLQGPDWPATSHEIAVQTQWRVGRIEQYGKEIRVTFDDAEAMYRRERVDRVVAVLHRDAAPSVDRFVLAYRVHGVDVAEHVVDRDVWVAEHTQPLPPRERRDTVMALASKQSATARTVFQNPQEKFESGLGLGYQQTLGGPNGFVLFQLFAAEQAKLRIRDDTWLQGTLRLALVDNYNKYTFNAPSNLPRVRTSIREYLTTSKLQMTNLQFMHVGRLSDNQYYSFYGGYLEYMYAGAGGEWLYRRFGSRVALGVDLNTVRQRGFRQDLELRDYRVATGHTTLYWDTGWNNVQATLSVGRYLAGDQGVTVNLSRTFRNGVRVGGYFSKTSVTAAQFGEGSFDKGLYLSIPFDAFLTRSSSTVGTFLWQPLLRDGGAKLIRSVMLYDLTNARDERTLRYAPAAQPNDSVIPEDRREAWTPRPSGPEPYTRVVAKPSADQWASDQRFEQRLTEALYSQEFRNIRIALDASRRLNLTLSNDQIRPVSRAVGRAARAALRFAPLDAREIRIGFEENAQPLVTYEFVDLVRLRRYFDGAIGQSELADYVAVEYLNPSARQKDPLERLGDLGTDIEDRSLAAVLLETRAVGRVKDDVSRAASTAAGSDWLSTGALGAGLVLASSVLDKRADRFARDHAENSWMKKGISVGNAIPWLALAGSAVAAVVGSDPVRSRTGYAAMEAGGAAFVVATGLKYAIGRARPSENAGSGSFKFFSATSGYDAFPSRHTIVSWAVATPFALEYNAPWLYGVAAISNLARIGRREHWFSDTVAGSLLGYGIGRLFYESSRAPRKGEPRVLLSPSGVNLAWELQ